MDKIQTAREIAIELGEIGLGSQWINATERRIRSRDRAIVERCKAIGENYMPNKPAWADWCNALDSVLRELEGEEVPNA